MTRLILALCLMLGPTGCTRQGAPQCERSEGRPVLVFTLFFGRAIPGREDLTNEEWLEFLHTIIAASLPDGYTVVDAKGGWRNPATNRNVEEATKVLVVALPDVPESMLSITRIRTAYEVQFHQHVVGMTSAPACGVF